MMDMASGESCGSITENPLKEDPLLKQLLEQQSQQGIESQADFDAWKASFVQRLESLLEPQGVVKASEAYEKIKENLKALAAICFKLQNEIDQGHLSSSGNDGEDSNAEVMAASSGDEGRKTLNRG